MSNTPTREQAEALARVRQHKSGKFTYADFRDFEKDVVILADAYLLENDPTLATYAQLEEMFANSDVEVSSISGVTRISIDSRFNTVTLGDARTLCRLLGITLKE